MGDRLGSRRKRTDGGGIPELEQAHRETLRSHLVGLGMAQISVRRAYVTPGVQWARNPGAPRGVDKVCSGFGLTGKEMMVMRFQYQRRPMSKLKIVPWLPEPPLDVEP